MGRIKFFQFLFVHLGELGRKNFGTFWGRTVGRHRVQAFSYFCCFFSARIFGKNPQYSLGSSARNPSSCRDKHRKSKRKSKDISCSILTPLLWFGCSCVRLVEVSLFLAQHRLSRCSETGIFLLFFIISTFFMKFESWFMLMRI